MDVCNVTFGAIRLNKKDILIKKLDKKTGLFEDCPVNFVRIDANNHDDIKAIDDTAKKWIGAEYAKKISTASHWMKTVPIEIYAITTQQNKFDKLKPNRLLGLAEMRNDDNRPGFKWLYRLQVKPEAINVNGEYKNYKYVGTSILDSLKKIYKNISLFSINVPSVEKFYKHNDFFEDYMGERHYVWTANIFKRLKIKYNKFMMRVGI